MGLRRLRDSHGRMYEGQLLIAVLLVGLAIGLPKRSLGGLLLGFLQAFLTIVGALFVLVALSLLSEKLSEVRWISAILENPVVRILRASFIWVLMFLFFGGLANLIAFVLLDRSSFSPGAQVALSAGAGLLVGALATALIYRSSQKNAPRF